MILTRINIDWKQPDANDYTHSKEAQLTYDIINQDNVCSREEADWRAHEGDSEGDDVLVLDLEAGYTGVC